MKEELAACFKAGIPLIAIHTLEVDRCTKAIQDIIVDLNYTLADTGVNEYLKENGLGFMVWNVNGWNSILPENSYGVDYREWNIARNALKLLLHEKALPGVYVLQNFNLLWQQQDLYPTIVTDIVNIASKKIQHRHVIVIGNIDQIPSDIATLFSWIDFKLPTRSELCTLTSKYDAILKTKLTQSDRESIADAVAGLTMHEADWGIRTSIVHTKGKGIDCKFLFNEKAKSVKKSGLIEYMADVVETIDDVGGVVTFKAWVDRVSKVFKNREDAAKYKLPIPRGTLLCGVSGTGKSLSAKAIARAFGLPLYRWDLGKLFGSLVGSTEKNTRESFRLIEAVSPAVFYIDEIEKSMAGVESSSYTDSGVLARVVGAFLTFLQEKTFPAFFVATANSVSRLSPELLRRFNGVWFVDLPNDNERKEIFQIHIRKTGRDPKKFNLDQLVNKTVDYTGAEIQNAVEEGMYSAFFRDEEYTTKDILLAVDNLPKLAETKREEIKALRAWSKGRARMANVEEGKKPVWWDSTEDMIIDNDTKATV